MSDHDYENPSWTALVQVVSVDMRDGWMWMSRTVQGGDQIEHYKHRITRSYLSLSADGRAWEAKRTQESCSPWCESDHEHRKDIFVYVETPAEAALQEALR